MESSNRAVYAAIGGNLAIAASKFVAAGFTGSASMLAEGIHSLVDTGDGLLLLWGEHVSRREPDEAQPFGYGKEMYFWTLIVALMIFALGGGVTVVEGVQRLLHPACPRAWGGATRVLGVAAVFEGYTWWVAFRQLRESDGEQGLWQAIRSSKDPRTFTVLFEDSAALAGIAVAFVGLLAGQLLRSPYPDGIASIAIGLILAAVAVLLARESKALLVGESARPELVHGHPRAGRGRRGRGVGPAPPDHAAWPRRSPAQPGRRSSARGSRPTRSWGRSVAIEGAIREKHPEVRRIFIEVDSPDSPRPLNGMECDPAAGEKTVSGTVSGARNGA